ncbi:VOC family protein [Angustibacter luteus]|uniref:VOC family protein n=1 Tax=Angustibacter luteus TaxID=658456 RepID=A0ABW1JF06_9ACTN
MTTPSPTVWPSLRYSDAPSAIRFIVDVLGFDETLVVPSDTGGVAHCQLSWPAGGGVMLGSGEGTHAKVPADAGGLYVVTETAADVDRIHLAAVAAGATSVREPEDQDYGGRVSTFVDPWGVHWSFGDYRGEPR